MKKLVLNQFVKNLIRPQGLKSINGGVSDDVSYTCTNYDRPCGGTGSDCCIEDRFHGTTCVQFDQDPHLNNCT